MRRTLIRHLQAAVILRLSGSRLCESFPLR
jgi:hypothetical protein